MADLATARREAKWALDSFDAETGKPDFHAAELAHHLRLLLAATEPAPAATDDPMACPDCSVKETTAGWTLRRCNRHRIDARFVPVPDASRGGRP